MLEVVLGPIWVWLAALVVFSAVFRYGLSRRVVAPWIMVDEIVYSELAKSFAAQGLVRCSWARRMAIQELYTSVP